MPDFERLTDQLMKDMAETPEELAESKGFIDGKNYARKQFLYIFCFLLGLFIVIFFTVFLIVLENV